MSALFPPPAPKPPPPPPRAGQRVFFVPRARKTRVLPSRRVPRRVALGAAAQTLVVVRVGVPGQTGRAGPASVTRLESRRSMVPSKALLLERWNFFSSALPATSYTHTDFESPPARSNAPSALYASVLKLFPAATLAPERKSPIDLPPRHVAPPLDGALEFRVVRVPQKHLPVERRGGDLLAVRGGTRRQHVVRVRQNVRLPAALVHVPQTHGLIPRPGSQRRALGGKRQARDRALVARQGCPADARSSGSR